MKTFQRWVIEYPDQYDENWKHALWAGPLAGIIGLGMHYGKGKPVKPEIPDPQPKIQHVAAAQERPVPQDKRIVSKKVTSDDADTFVHPTEPQKYTQLPQVRTPKADEERPAPVVRPGRLKSERPEIKPTEDQPPAEPLQVVHDKTPPTPEEIKISQGHPSVKAIKEGDSVVYRSTGSAVVNNRDLNSAIKLARAVAVSNLMKQIQNKGVVRFRQGADKDVKIYTKSSKNGGVVVVFVVRDFNPDGVSITPERDDEGLRRESTSHRSFQSYVSYRRKSRT